MDDYLHYAATQLQHAILKNEDAPASSAMHERAALMALILERVPTTSEVTTSWETLKIEICLGCGKPTADRDCGCPAGTGYIRKSQS